MPSNTLKKGKKEEYQEEEQEDDDEEEEMKGTRRDVEDMQDSLVVVEGMMIKFPQVTFAPFQLLLQVSFHQEDS